MGRDSRDAGRKERVARNRAVARNRLGEEQSWESRPVLAHLELLPHDGLGALLVVVGAKVDVALLWAEEQKNGEWG
jgi:hypothetical protein